MIQKLQTHEGMKTAMQDYCKLQLTTPAKRKRENHAESASEVSTDSPSKKPKKPGIQSTKHEAGMSQGMGEGKEKVETAGETPQKELRRPEQLQPQLMISNNVGSTVTAKVESTSKISQLTTPLNP